MIRTKTLRSHLSYFHWFPIDIHFHFEFLKLVFGSLQGITCPFFLQPPSALQPEISALLQFSCGTGLSSTLYVRKRCLQLSGLQNSPSPFFFAFLLLKTHSLHEVCSENQPRLYEERAQSTSKQDWSNSLGHFMGGKPILASPLVTHPNLTLFSLKFCDYLAGKHISKLY